MFSDLTITALVIVLTIAATLLIQRRLRGEKGDPSAYGGKHRESAPASDDVQALLAAYQRDRAAAGEPVNRTVPVPAAMGRAVEANPAVQVKTPGAFLNGPAKVFYLVLKAALPEYHVFAYARLTDVVKPVGRPMTPQGRAQFAQSRVDFVVCNKDLVVVALLDLSNGTRPDDPMKQQLQAQLAAAGIRYVRVAPNAIPKPPEARSLILGGHADFCPTSTQVRLRHLP